MRASHGALRPAERLEQPIHLALIKGHVDLDRGVAGNEGGDSVSQNIQRDGASLLAGAVQDFAHQIFRIVRANFGGRGLDGNRPRAEGFDLKPVGGQFLCDLLTSDLLLRLQLQNDGHQQPLDFNLLLPSHADMPVKQNPLVSRMLIHNPKPACIDRHDEALLNLAERLEVQRQFARRRNPE